MPRHQRKIVVEPRIYMSQRERILFIERAKKTCEYCGQVGTSVAADPAGRSWHIDHRMPLSRGGKNHIDNLALACTWCNLSKGNKLVAELDAIRQTIVRKEEEAEQEEAELEEIARDIPQRIRTLPPLIPSPGCAVLLPEEVAAHLEITVKQVMDLVDARIIPGLRLNRRVIRIPAERFNALTDDEVLAAIKYAHGDRTHKETHLDPVVTALEVRVTALEEKIRTLSTECAKYKDQRDYARLVANRLKAKYPTARIPRPLYDESAYDDGWHPTWNPDPDARALAVQEVQKEISSYGYRPS